MKVISLCLAIFFWMPNFGFAQISNNIGLEVQVYPAGVIPGLRGGLNLDRQNELNLRLGYNITRRGDFGKHDNEEGGGPGFGFGYRYYLLNKRHGLFLGARTDLWFMDIDWRGTSAPIAPPGAQPVTTEGSTDIVVLQPTLEAGYNILKNNADWLLAPTVSFGYEFNARTEGEEVGEGAILLGGLNLEYNF